MKKKKLVKFIVSIIVVLSIIIGTVSASAVAATDIFKDDYIPSRIVEEVKELREASSKTFLCEDGSYMAVTYAEPIHYKSGDDWVEIDNTLVFKDKETYMPKSTNTQIELPFNLAEGDIFLKSENADLTFGFDKSKESFNKKSFAKKVSIDELASNGIYGRNKQNENYKNVDNPEIAEIEKYNSEFTTIKNQKSALIYENVFPDTDVEYIISSNNLKENIVINKPQDKYIYTYILNTNLVPASNDNGTISFKDNNDKTVFSISAPYMYDMSRSESTEIKMTIDKSDEGFIVTVNADSNWINGSNRTYPVIIDPDITINIDPSDIDDVFVENGVFAGQTRSNNELRVGKNLTNITRTYIKTTLPTTIPFGSIITSAKLYLYKDYYYQAPSQDNINIVACDCSSRTTWQSSSVTWNNQPFSNSANGYSSVSDCQLSSVEATSSKNNYEFELKVAAQKWLNTGVNKGIMLASSNENSKTQIDFHSTRSSTTDSVPKMTIKYKKAGVTPTTWSPVAEPSSQFITVTCNPSWTITSSESWLTYYGKTSSGFTAKVAKNTSTTKRDGTLTISSGSRIIGHVNVRQLGTDPSLLVDKTIIIKECGSCTDNFTITSNTSWSIATSTNQISVSPRTGNGSKTINIIFNENDSSNTINGSITVTAGGITRTISVKQLDNLSSKFTVSQGNSQLRNLETSEYNHGLARWSMLLSSHAYNPISADSIMTRYMDDFKTVTEELGDFGFQSSNIETYNYNNTQVNTTAHTIAYRNICSSDGSEKTLIIVVVRGSTVIQDWITDSLCLIPSQYVGFIGAKNNVKSNLNNFLQIHSSEFENDKIILITGHSLGGAVSNLLAADLNNDNNWGSDKVFSYTFACPNVGYNLVSSFSNIFNIINRNDIVPLVPFDSSYNRYGIDISILMGPDINGNNPVSNHLMRLYYGWLNNNGNEDSNLDWILGKSHDDIDAALIPKLLSVHCPVSVSVNDMDGNVLAFESGQSNSLEVGINIENSVTSWVDDNGGKYFFIPYGMDDTVVRVEAYDYGTMDISVRDITRLSNENTGEKIFNNVVLYPGKEFEMNMSDDEPTENSQLFIIENGEIIGEVTETNPHFIGISTDLNDIVYPTPIHLTIITDTTVTEMNLYNQRTGNTMHLVPDGVYVQNIANSGNSLIWTIGYYPPSGTNIYNISVKSGEDWHDYENIIEIRCTRN